MTLRLLLPLIALSACEGGDKVDSQGTLPGSGTTTPTGTYNPTNPDGEGPAAVDLGGLDSAANGYVLLAKTAITNVTGSSLTGGNVGLSPAAASFITGFGLIADPTSVFSTSAAVVAPGQVWAADYADPTPTLLTTDVLAMQAAYSDAASRNPPDELNLADGNLGGLTLAPGLYRWGSAVTIPTDLTLAGGADDTWIFQISDNFDISAAQHVLLSGGARAQNITWQVAGAVTIHEDAHVEGVILSKTGIVLQTNASLHGRALAQTMIALDDNVVATP